ncbi:hypothetical protein GQ53DRAFT_170514 [Thozetella sp. PMI_491]|nr:hypothetical protein GQ53DRAFT_170514 [Thozetella sp. PMI_491]
MAEVLGLLASIIEVSAFGIKLARTLKNYGASVAGAERRLQGLDRDIDFTSGILTELRLLLEDTHVQALVSERSIKLATDAVAECHGIFHAMEDVAANLRRNELGKFKLYSRESKIALLRSNLDRMKGNLQLLMGVINQATQLSNTRPDEVTLGSHRKKIRELMLEKETYTQKYLIEKQKYDALLAHVNSTSTLGSICTTQTVEEQPIRVTASNTRLDGPKREQSVIQNTPGDSPKTSPDNDIQPSNPLAAYGNFFEAISTDLGPNLMPGTGDDDRDNDPLDEISAIQDPEAQATAESQYSRKNRLLKHRQMARRAAQNTAKGIKYTLVGTAAVILFPVTIALFIVRRRRRAPAPLELNSSKVSPGDFYPPRQYPVLKYPELRSNYFDPGIYFHSSDVAYTSSLIPAELPATHELGANPEFSLVSELADVPSDLVQRAAQWR